MSYHHGSTTRLLTAESHRKQVKVNGKDEIVETEANASGWREYKRPVGEPILIRLN